MSAVAIVLVLTAAVLHALWNVLLKTSGDPLRTAVRLQAIGTVVLVPVGILAWFATGRPALEPAGIAVAFVSGILETIYFLVLSAAYARGDLSLVYPIARGSAPLLAIVIGIVVLGERLPPLAYLGIGALVLGILLVARPWRAFRAAGREHRAAIGLALLTGAMIAAYSAVDRVGVRILVPWAYGAFLAVFATVMLAATVEIGRRLRLLGPAPEPESHDPFWRDGLIGVMSLTAYLLVLFAYSLAPLAAVAPLRESGIVVAAAWGTLRLGEAVGRRDAASKIVAAGLVVLGAVLLAVAR